MGRWDPRPLPGARADDEPVRLTEDIDDVDDPAETLAHARQHAARIQAQLRNQPPTDPVMLERMQREHRHWQRVIDSVGLGDHWDSGAGDRTLF